jgi:hypothetical protein
MRDRTTPYKVLCLVALEVLIPNDSECDWFSTWMVLVYDLDVQLLIGCVHG